MRTKKVTEITEKSIVEVNKVTTQEYLDDSQFCLPQTVDYLDMDRQYRQLMFLHEAAIEQVTAKLNILKGEFQFSNDRNPISGISSRIKSKESIIFKMQKKGLPMTASAL